MYSVRGVGTYTGVVPHAAFGLWNPHGSQLVKVKRIVLSEQSGASIGALSGFRRSSARGTPASTVTPDVSNDGKRGAAPPSGLLLDLGSYSVEPTLDADDIGPIHAQSGGTASGDADFFAHDYPGDGFYIPPGTGLCLVKLGTGTVIYEVSVTWSEDA